MKIIESKINNWKLQIFQKTLPGDLERVFEVRKNHYYNEIMVSSKTLFCTNLIRVLNIVSNRRQYFNSSFVYYYLLTKYFKPYNYFIIENR